MREQFNSSKASLGPVEVKETTQERGQVYGRSIVSEWVRGRKPLVLEVVKACRVIPQLIFEYIMMNERLHGVEEMWEK